jgi:uncharacterized delta-60 repeat protein
MSLTLLGILNAQAIAGVSYWLATLGGSGGEIGNSVAADSGGNSYTVGKTDSTGAGGFDFLLAKRDSAGTIQWQRVLGGTASEIAWAVAIDSLDNIYVAGETSSLGAGGGDFLLAKYNSSGTIQWQRILGGTSSEIGRSVAIDLSDNVYVFGETFSVGAGGGDFLIAKYNSSGTIQWQRILGGTSNEIGNSVAIDSLDNVYVLGETNSSGAGQTDFLIAKYNSSGTIQWQRVLGGTGNDNGYSIAIDSSDNIYVLGETISTGAGSRDFLLAKYNSSGTIQWQRVLGGTSVEQGYSVAIDSLDNVYVLGNTISTGAGDFDFLLAKYNSSGTIQWQRVLGGAGRDKGYSIAIDSSDTLYALGFTASTGAGGDDFLLAKLPNDGSLTGTYVLDGVNMIYAAATLTAATSTLTAATSTLTAATSTLTAATSTLTDASASLTSHFVEIPA